MNVFESSAVSVLAAPSVINDALGALLSWSEEVHMAFAWASSAEGKAAHWKAVPLKKVKRAVLGIHFAQTEPFVLRELRKLGILRVVPDTGGVFHPKVIVGLNGTEARAVVGSSNFTLGGFSGNTELNIALAGSAKSEPLASILKFVTEQWKHPRAFEPDDAWIDSYEKLYNARPAPPRVHEKKKSVPRRITSVKDLNVGWTDYVRLIGSQERRSLWTGWEIHVFDNADGSYLQEVEACQRAFRLSASFEKMPLEDRKLVAGWGGGSRGYFGRMFGAGTFKNLTAEHPHELSVALDHVPLKGPVSTKNARDYLVAALAIEGVAMGTATRLITMKRPDRFLPANLASQEKIAEVFGHKADTIDRYLDVMSTVWTLPWATASRPDDPTELRLWRARVALLDAIFYEPT